jgi:hypothetical protein
MQKKQKNRIKNFNSGIKLSAIAAVIIGANLFLFVHIFGMDLIDFLIPSRENVGVESNFELEDKVRRMTSGYPIEEMAEYIAMEDEQVAAFLVSIAKKESNWGKRSPKLDGENCYNYWGFRQKRERMGTGGHTCFDNPREAVKVVSGRIEDLISKGAGSPANMIVWKCGYSCDTHSEESVSKWIDDVSYYYEKFYN